MKIAAIFALAALAGVAVYALSLRASPADATSGARRRWLPWGRRRDETAVGDDREIFAGSSAVTDADPDEADSFAYIRLGLAPAPTWRTRLVSALGLIVLVAFAAIALGAALWLIGHLTNQQIQQFLEPTPRL